MVPGPDGELACGGHCLIKDVNNLKYLCHQHGTGERLLTALLTRNDDLRGDRDWERMKDRAVTDK